MLWPADCLPASLEPPLSPLHPLLFLLFQSLGLSLLFCVEAPLLSQSVGTVLVNVTCFISNAKVFTNSATFSELDTYTANFFFLTSMWVPYWHVRFNTTNISVSFPPSSYCLPDLSHLDVWHDCLLLDHGVSLVILPWSTHNQLPSPIVSIPVDAVTNCHKWAV